MFPRYTTIPHLTRTPFHHILMNPLHHYNIKNLYFFQCYAIIIVCDIMHLLFSSLLSSSLLFSKHPRNCLYLTYEHRWSKGHGKDTPCWWASKVFLFPMLTITRSPTLVLPLLMFSRYPLLPVMFSPLTLHIAKVLSVKSPLQSHSTGILRRLYYQFQLSAKYNVCEEERRRDNTKAMKEEHAKQGRWNGRSRRGNEIHMYIY